VEIFQDPIIITILALTIVCGIAALRADRWASLWLPVLTILLFALPRAGIIVQQVRLPLPVAHVLCAVLVLEWLLLRRGKMQDRSRLGRYFLLYAAVAGFGLAVGLSGGSKHIITLLELCFYLFSIGLFFYASETFCHQRQFLKFARLILIISVLVSLYGIAQRYLGTSILIPHVTYNAGSDVSMRKHLEIASVVYIRVLSSYGDPNVLASQLLMFIGIAFALLIGRGVSGFTRLLCVGVLTVNVICLIFTYSRAGLVGLVLVPLIILWWRTRWSLLFIPVIAILGLFVVPSLVVNFLEARFQGVISGGDYRLLFPRMAWQLLNITPYGCGFGRSVILETEGISWTFRIVSSSGIWRGFNSFWLNLFCRLGVPGIIAFSVVLFVLFRYVWTKAKLVENSMVKAVLIGGLAGCMGQCFIWLANNTYMLPGGGLNFWFMMGMLVAGCRAFAPQQYSLMLPVQPLWPNKRMVPA
jgi:hypothetical protein